MQAITIDQYGITTRVKKGDYNRAKKLLKIKEIYYYAQEGEEKKFIRKISVNDMRFFYKPFIYKTNFKHEELKNCYVIEEEKQ